MLLRLFLEVPAKNWWNIKGVQPGSPNYEFVEKYNLVANSIFGIALPVITAIALTICVVFAIITGIKISKANSAEEKNTLKKKLIWNIAGLFIVGLAQFLIPAIATWITKGIINL